MYTEEIILNGILFLGDENLEDILISRTENIVSIKQERIKKEEWQMYKDRYKVPHGLNKKELTELKKETTKELDECRRRIRENIGMPGVAEDDWEQWKQKKNKIEAILTLHKEFGIESIEKAKKYPIEQLIEIHGGIAKCIFHDDSSPSMKLYKEQNRVYCFGCNQGHDAIDIYMKVHGVSFNTAVKALSLS